MAAATSVPKTFSWKLCCIAIYNRRICKQLFPSLWSKNVIIGFDRIEQRMFRMSNETAGGVCEGYRFLEKILRKLFN